MAPTTFHLLAMTHESAGISAQLKAHVDPKDILYLGRVQHWLHVPKLSIDHLLGRGERLTDWQYLIATESKRLPAGLLRELSDHWSISAEVDEGLLAMVASMAPDAGADTTPPSFPGWNSDDHSGLDNAVAPSDLEASVGMPTRAMGSPRSAAPPPLGDFVRAFGSKHTGPINVFNLLSYLPDQRERYFQYIAAFQKSVGSTYGGTPQLLGFGVVDWSSRAEEANNEQIGSWEDAALIRYPSIWHFAKMLDSPEYAAADRDYKQGVLRDNPLLCVVPLSID
ncbi:Hypothetical protein D9617_30g011000 [Elsinoe fawcettii]|nr:Hypothetical protein D9617_30g011000 [Elsinoe fawcettii]